MKSKFKSVKTMAGMVALSILLVIAAIGCSNGDTSGVQDKGNVEQAKEPVTQKVRFSEVIRSIFYAPHYIAMEKGFFKEEGIEVDMVTSQGSDKGAAALLAGTADISLIGPETTIYIVNQNGDQKLKVFHQLTSTDGSFLLSREKLDNFTWADVAGKSVVSWRPGSAPQMVIQSVLNKQQVQNAKLITNIAAPSMVGAFTSGEGDYIQVYEPLASMLEKTGKAYMVASLGEAIGDFPETSYVATEQYIKEHPEMIRKWSNAVTKATNWLLEHSADEAAEALAPYFEGTEKDLIAKSVERYKSINSWSADPELTAAQFDALQNVLVENGVLKAEQKVQRENVVDLTLVQEANGGK